MALGGLLAAALATGCARDFDGLFVEDGKPSGSSGTSGTSGDQCSCGACDGVTCDFKCPSDCAACACKPTICKSSCVISCTEGTSCDVDCIGEAVACKVVCAAGAQCHCTGKGCGVSCAGTQTTCKDGSIACQRDCP